MSSTFNPPIAALIAWTIIVGGAIIAINLAKFTKYTDKDNAGYVREMGWVEALLCCVVSCWRMLMSTMHPSYRIAVVFAITAGISTYLLWYVHPHPLIEGLPFPFLPP